MAQQELFLNVLDSTLTGYIQLEPQLREYLEELYPASSYGYIAFNICVCSSDIMFVVVLLIFAL
jgi:hypothetical protein